MRRAVIVPLAFAFCTGLAGAQPSRDPEQADRAVNAYAYMMNSRGPQGARLDQLLAQRSQVRRSRVPALPRGAGRARQEGLQEEREGDHRQLGQAAAVRALLHLPRGPPRPGRATKTSVTAGARRVVQLGGHLGDRDPHLGHAKARRGGAGQVRHHVRQGPQAARQVAERPPRGRHDDRQSRRASLASVPAIGPGGLASRR